jgi:hypothetical protein
MQSIVSVGGGKMLHCVAMVKRALRSGITGQIADDDIEDDLFYVLDEFVF